MSDIVIYLSVTLDGVMQAPARPDEDTRGGFAHGGWAVPFSDPELGRVAGDAMQAVARLREAPGKDIVVLGSGELTRNLMRNGLVDRYVLSIHPLVLGSGRRLFPDDGTLAKLRLTNTQTTTTGVVIATYAARSA
jgi:dihydrofolate reductase